MLRISERPASIKVTEANKLEVETTAQNRIGRKRVANFFIIHKDFNLLLPNAGSRFGDFKDRNFNFHIQEVKGKR